MADSPVKKNGYYSSMVGAYRSQHKSDKSSVKVERTLKLGEGEEYLLIRPLSDTVKRIDEVVHSNSRHGTIKDIADEYESKSRGFIFPHYLSQFFDDYSNFITGSSDDYAEVSRIFRSPMQVYLKG